MQKLNFLNLKLKFEIQDSGQELFALCSTSFPTPARHSPWSLRELHLDVNIQNLFTDVIYHVEGFTFVWIGEVFLQYSKLQWCPMHCNFLMLQGSDAPML